MARLALVLLAGLLLELGIPLVLRWSPIRRALRARLEYAFGRPVEVGWFDFRLFRGLRLEAHAITVAEDPRFGQEFFLYADGLTAGLDWPALLRGRLRFARFTFTRPSLNVVIAPGGAWNVEVWLESRATAGNAAALGAASPARPRQIVVREGRINFKRGLDKQPFSLVGVAGTLAPEAGGLWRMEFVARLLRAGVALQEAGTLRFLGRLPEAGALPPAQPAGGPPAAMAPAQLDLAWQRASLSDALRLVTGDDRGVRGSLEGTLSVRGPVIRPAEDADLRGEIATSPAAQSSMWSFRAALRLSGIHRWDLALRRDHPAVNLEVEGAVAANRSRWEFTKVTLEAPRSSLRARGTFARDNPEETHFRFLSSSIHIDDLFAWYRAFHTGVADGVALDGYLGVDVETSGWPPRIERGALATDGARVLIPGIKKGFELGRAVLRITPKGAELSPLTLSMGDASGNFHLSARSQPGPGSPAQAVLTGETERVEELFAAVAALGLTHAQGWRAEGAVRARLRWQGTGAPWRLAPSGTLDFEDVDFRAGALALPIHVASAHVEMTAADRRVRLSAAEFLGAQWSGTLNAKTFAGPWSFSLGADRLDTAEFGHWFPARAAGGPIESSLLGDEFDAGRLAWPESFAATGRLTVGEVAIGRLRLGKLNATASVANRRLEFSPADAEFYGGRVRGTFRVGFGPAPRYDVDAQFERVNLAALTDPHPTLQGCCSGTGSGNLTFTARGVGREALLKSFEGKGTAEVLGAKVHSIDLRSSIESGAAQVGISDFSRIASAKFSIGSAQTNLEFLTLSGPQGAVEGKGTISLSGALDLDLIFSPPGKSVSSAGRVTTRFLLAGTVASPQLALASRP